MEGYKNQIEKLEKNLSLHLWGVDRTGRKCKAKILNLPKKVLTEDEVFLIKEAVKKHLLHPDGYKLPYISRRFYLDMLCFKSENIILICGKSRRA